jgi:hypothetical protein
MPPHSKSDHAVLATALDHAWHWYELRNSQVLQLANFYMVVFAVLAGGYASALTAKQYALAGVAGILMTVDSALVYFIGGRLRDLANLANEPLTEIENRLASTLDLDSLRMLEVHRASRPQTWKRIDGLSTVVFGLAAIAGVVAAVFAWFGH